MFFIVITWLFYCMIAFGVVSGIAIIGGSIATLKRQAVIVDGRSLPWTEYSPALYGLTTVLLCALFVSLDCILNAKVLWLDILLIIVSFTCAVGAYWCHLRAQRYKNNGPTLTILGMDITYPR